MFKEIFISFFLFIFLLSFNVSALGIAPSRIGYVNFVPNLTISREIHVFNTLNTNFPVEMELKGDLAEYATLSEYEFVLAPMDTRDSVKILELTVNLPEKLEEPGEHVLSVGALQAPPENVPAGMLVARVKAATGLFVFLPYPGKYIDADLLIENARVNETITFKINVRHRGNLTINSVSGVIEVYDSAGKRVTYLRTESMSLEPGQSIELKAEWLATNIRPGNYRASAVVDYDGIKKEIEKEFRIGSPTINIINVTAEPITNGTVGKITAEVRSYWDEKIPNVYASVLIKRGLYSGGAASPSITLNPFSEANLEMYWDTAEAAGSGDYPANVTVYYLNETDTMPVTLKVMEPGFGFPIEMIIILVLIIVIVVILLFYRRKRKKSKQKRLM